MEGLNIVTCLLVMTTWTALGEVSSSYKAHRPQVLSMTFLITVNDSWEWVPPIDNGTYVCVNTTKTTPLHPDTPVKNAPTSKLGNCDTGSLIFSVKRDTSGNSVVVPTFVSTQLPLADPASCSIEWNETYLYPKKVLGLRHSVVANESLLPGCLVSEERGGVHTTVYWFHILEWAYLPNVEASYGELSVDQQLSSPPKVNSVAFLVAVNHTSGCMMTSNTDPLMPGVKHKQSDYIHVGKCDFGPLDFKISTSRDLQGENHTYIDLVFTSQNYANAPQATCRILWDYSYTSDPQNSLLPGCYTTTSSKEFQKSYYWFYVLDWRVG